MVIQWKFLCTILIVLIAGTVAIELEKNVMKTWKNNRYYGFRGIRYAEPPTGPRRFRVNIAGTTAFKMPIYSINSIRFRHRPRQAHGEM